MLPKVYWKGALKVGMSNEGPALGEDDRGDDDLEPDWRLIDDGDVSDAKSLSVTV